MRKTDNNLISPNFKNFLELLGKYENNGKQNANRPKDLIDLEKLNPKS